VTIFVGFVGCLLNCFEIGRILVEGVEIVLGRLRSQGVGDLEHWVVELCCSPEAVEVGVDCNFD